ncbi:hypothetical protein [Paenibacillus xerothermodurans]|uniref:Amidase n=1 Tax=Paenibacillus xerothermodurans TaxID=1977292 RepID=A0A2W1NCL8_PAEXE|nr:hypothetical protein [Paenibacillus xerothermodurans]PZE21400.1 hypothetical protein CBW46_008570 [Paenibacillus xerothermodurans]
MSLKKRMAVVLLLLLVPVLLYYLNVAHTNVKATWVWDSTEIAQDSDEIVSFADQNGVNLIYLYINPKQDYNDYRTFVKKARESGIAVHALGGDPSWSTDEERHRITEFVTWVSNYNEMASKREQITGIHLDVEPYNQQAWNTDQRQAIIDGWLESMEHFVTLTGEMTSLDTGADLPFWLDEIPVSQQPNAQSMSEWFMERLDHVTLMAYRNTADSDGGILDVIEEEVQTANELGKKVVVGIETNEMPDKYTTFHDTDTYYKKEQLALVENNLGGHPSYYGVAIHDYAAWSRSIDS